MCSCKNFGRGQNFTLIDETLARANVEPDMIMELPSLHVSTMRKVDTLNLNFWAAVNVKEGSEGALSLMERRRVKIWLRKAYEQIGDLITIVA